MAEHTQNAADIILKSEPVEDWEMESPHDSFQPLDSDDCSDLDTTDLESIVKKLVNRVKLLEQQIAACLETQPLLYQVFGKCNRLEQRLKAMRHMNGGGAGREEFKPSPVQKQLLPKSRKPNEKAGNLITTVVQKQNPLAPNDIDCERGHQDVTEDSLPRQNPLRCKVCPSEPNNAFENEATLASHYINTHEIVQSTCTPSTRQRKPTSSSTRTCPHCSKLFYSRWEMKHHVLIKHSGTRPPPVPCDLCTKQFCDKKAAKTHQLQIHGRVTEQVASLFKYGSHSFRKLPCPDACGRTFQHASQIRHHLVSCRKLKPHQCEECGKRFRHESTLRTHHKSEHRGERAFTCDQCGKGFVSSWSLGKHAKMHGGGEERGNLFGGVEEGQEL